jgi:hypothetical protein
VKARQNFCGERNVRDLPMPIFFALCHEQHGKLIGPLPERREEWNAVGRQYVREDG